MADRLLSPSKITAWLDCGHYLTLRERLDAGLLEAEVAGFGSFARLLADKGSQHEAECLEYYRAEGRSIYEVPARESGERFDEWVTRVGSPWDHGYDVIYQMPFVHDGMRGIADFLLRVDNPSAGLCSYEPLDAKLARTEAKPGHVLQLCFYADALRAATGTAPERLHLWLGSGHIESLVTKEFHPYWNRLRNQLRQLLADDAPAPETRPTPCAHCEFCEFVAVCDAQWRQEDSLVYVAGIRGNEVAGLEDCAITTLTGLAECTDPVDALRPERLERLVSQAELQVEARDDPDGPPPFHLTEAGADPTWGHGLELLPEPDDGDVFLDFEGDPFWTVESGLFFLFGLIARGVDGAWTFEARWAHDRAGEERATKELIEYLENRRASHPGMHVYHYNHTERSALERLAADHGVGEVALSEMVATGFFVDLYPVVRNAIQAGTESYGLKDVERLTSYVRGHEIDQGAAAVVEYEHYMAAPDPAVLERIAAYNEDDVRATLALRDWLVGLRPIGLPWRAARLEREDEHPELDERIAALHAYGPDTHQHLLGDLLGYWVREFRAYKAPKLASTCVETGQLLENPDVIGGLEFVGLEPRYGAKGQELKSPGARFRWPEQALSGELLEGGASVLYGSLDGPTGYTSISDVDEAGGEVVLVWNEKAAELGVYPSAVALHDWVQPNPKPAALDALAAGVLGAPDSAPPNPASLSLLRRNDPAFTPGGGPPSGEFSDDLSAMCGWVTALDGSCISIQGPPGTGKTYWGAHLVHALVCAGRRVGITAMSHHAIDNLLEGVVEVFAEKAGPPCAPRGPQGARSRPAAASGGHLCHGRQCPLRQAGLQRRRRHHLALRQPGPAGSTRRRADRRRGGAAGPGRCTGRLHVGQEHRAAGGPAPTPAGGPGRASRGWRIERPPTRARRRRDDAARPGGLPDRDQTDAPRRVPVHFGGDLRGAAREPSGLRSADHRVRDRAPMAPGRPRRVHDGVARGGRARRRPDRSAARHDVGEQARGRLPAGGRGLHGRRPVQRPGRAAP